MREYGVDRCGEGCGTTRRWQHAPDEWRARLHHNDPLWKHVTYMRVAYCPACGTRVGIDERGPWRECMVPRAALIAAEAERDKLWRAAEGGAHSSGSRARQTVEGGRVPRRA